MKIIKKIVHFLALITYILAIIYALIMVPILFKYYPLVVLSGSMEPNLKTGSIIYYHKVDKEDLKVGDIVTYKLDDKYISHRIVGIENDLYTTKGDANETNDVNKIRYDNIIGKNLNICVIYLGYFVNFINNNLYIITFVFIILILEFIFKIRRNKNEKI